MAHKSSENNFDSEYIYYSIILILLAIGFVIRITGLTKFGFTADDEYYIIKSVQNILHRGLPEFATGGYYARGILYQYFSAGLILIGVDDVTALRIIPVICNVLSIIPLYLIASKVTNKSSAFLAVFLFAFSTWEIEISRLARFYAPFELIFLWYIYFLLGVIKDNALKKYRWLFILSIIGILVHEEGIFLLFLNFLPLYTSKIKDKLTIVLSVIIFIAGAFFTLYDFRNLGVNNYLPGDVVLNKVSHFPLYLPQFLLPQLLSKGLWLVIFVIPFSAFIVYSLHFIKKQEIKKEEKFYFVIIGLSALLNQFGLAVILVLILSFSMKLNLSLLKKNDLIKVAGFFIITFLFYIIYCLNNLEWLKWFNESFSINKLLWVNINYPDIYEKFFRAWFDPFPRLTIIILFSAGIIIFLFFKKTITGKAVAINENLSNLFLVAITLSSLVMIIVTPFMNLRYWFFIYPTFLVFIAFLVYRIQLIFKSKILKYITTLSILVFIFYFSEDHEVKYLTNVDSLKNSFRINYPRKLAETYYFKENYKSTAKIISQNMKPNDITISTVAPIEYYLPKLDYYYRSYDDVEFWGRSRDGGRKEVWTNSNLLYKENQLINLVDESKVNIWLITYTNTRPGPLLLTKD